MPMLRLFVVAALSLAATFAHVAHAVVPLTGATAVEAGGLHSCALTTGGSVKCWGNNNSGQLGNGTTTDSTAAVDVSGLTTGVAVVVTGYGHTCALTTGGGVKCWGANSWGQLGNGTTTSTLTPVDVTGLTAGVAAIAAGDYHTCAVTTGGGLKCWGSNTSGQLGNGTNTQALTAVDVTGLAAGVAAVAAGEGHTCALTSGGSVTCWGNNNWGQLGNGTTTAALTPVDVTGLTAGVVAIAAGFLHSCALTNGGGVKCWGGNRSGQLGNGTTTDALTPVDVTGLTAGVIAIAPGGGVMPTSPTFSVSHTCALTTGGGVKCWGDNSNGQLGNGTTTQALTPVDVTGLTAGAAAIAVGRLHSCALTAAGGVKCWGSGAIGNGTTGIARSAVDVTGLTAGVAAIASGGSHTCALTAAGGVKCWGSGALGNGTATQSLAPVDVTGLTAGVNAIAAGFAHSCALTNVGGVKCWGDNLSGQLGNGTTTQALTPVDVTGLTAGVAAVAAGNRHTCALTTGGGVKCWGANDSGQLGNGTTMQALTPVDVTGLTSGVAAVAAGGGHTCALTAGGAMKCWGSSSSGQVGNGTVTQALTAVDVTGLATGVVVIAAGGLHSCAVTAGSGVKCWGSNFWGQLGDPTTTGSFVPIPVNVVGLAGNVAALTAGNGHTCALTGSGGVKCWGINFSGELGNGSTAIQSTTPVDVTGLITGVGVINAGLGHTCALTTLGSVKCWGNGPQGQLGNGSAGYFPTPQVVVVTACADFTDVDPNSTFCTNVQWLRNRAVTLGCASTTQYCPGESVIRLAMAAFMNRLGTSLTGIVVSRQVASGALDPGTSPVVCATTDRTESGFQRRVSLDGVFTATAGADVGLATDPVVSFDAGATWLPVATQGQRGLVRANRWANLRSLGSFDVAPGQTWRVGLRVSRGGLPGAATLSDSGCNLRVRIDNRNGELQPF